MPATGATIRVPHDVFVGLCAMQSNPDLDPGQDFIECMQYLTRYECYRPTQLWIEENFHLFWQGCRGRFVEEKANEPKTAQPVCG